VFSDVSVNCGWPALIQSPKSNEFPQGHKRQEISSFQSMYWLLRAQPIEVIAQSCTQALQVGCGVRACGQFLRKHLCRNSCTLLCLLLGIWQTFLPKVQRRICNICHGVCRPNCPKHHLPFKAEACLNNI
jgi:hypothetical protein